MPSVYSEDDNARREALQVLGRSGKLRELIARVEAQAKVSPQSVAILQNLADYYRAANDQLKLRATYETIAKLRPDDARAQLQIGLQLIESGRAAAIKKEPALFGRDYYRFENAFRQANKYDDLIALIEEIDVRSLGNYYSATNIAQNLMNDPKTRDRGLKLFRRVWDAFPIQRPYLIQNLYNAQVWQLPRDVRPHATGNDPRARSDSG
jgi:tetratricopeptide (TPR) repeat protein